MDGGGQAKKNPKKFSLGFSELNGIDSSIEIRDKLLYAPIK